MLNQLVSSEDTAIVELPVSGSIADFIIVNESATVYEIKTALDNFERLDSQISDYSRAFAKVCVVIPAEKLERLLQKIDNPKIGIVIQEHLQKFVLSFQQKNWKGCSRKSIIQKLALL